MSKKFLICDECLYHLQRNWMIEKGTPISMFYMMCREKPKCFFKDKWKGKSEEFIINNYLTKKRGDV